MIAPLISKLHYSNDSIGLQRLVRNVLFINIGFCVITCITLLLIGPYILSYFGSEFSNGFLPLLILCIGHLVNILAGPAGNVLCMSGFERKAFHAGVLGTLVNLLLNLFLIPIYGMTGAAIATAFSFIVWNGLQAYYVKKYIGIKSYLTF